MNPMPNNIYGLSGSVAAREKLSHSDLLPYKLPPPHWALRKCVAALSTESKARILPPPPGLTSGQ